MKHITRIIGISMITNFFLALFKFIFGILGKSSALVADGIHSFSDLSTDVVAFFGSKLANKPADEKHPFGHGKVEYLTSLIIGVVVLLLGLSLIADSVSKDIVVPNIYVIFVSLFTILAKYILSSYLVHSGKKYDNTILIASGKESRADVVSSIFVLVAAVCMQLQNAIPMLKYADIVASIIVGLFIVHTGFSLIKENVSVIIGEQETDKENLDRIKELLLSDEAVIKIDRLTVLKFGPSSSITCELTMNGNLSLFESHRIVDNIENQIKSMDHRYKYITIHINPD